MRQGASIVVTVAVVTVAVTAAGFVLDLILLPLAVETLGKPLPA